MYVNGINNKRVQRLPIEMLHQEWKFKKTTLQEGIICYRLLVPYISSPFSFGMKIHRSKYNTNPVPQKRNRRENSNRKNHNGIEVCSPRPPHTPPIHLSLLDFVKVCSQFPIDIFSALPLLIFIYIQSYLSCFISRNGNISFC